MCLYRYVNDQADIGCQAAWYITLFNPDTSSKRLECPTSELPLDQNGLCLFHSPHADWKRENNFVKWFDVLLEVVKQVDLNQVDLGKPFKDFHFIGFTFIANTTKKAGKRVEQTFTIKGLRLRDHVQLFFDHAIFSVPVQIQNCRIPKTELNFNHCTFSAEVQITNSKIFQCAFNEASLTGGIFINKCIFYRYTEFAASTIEKAFQLVSTDFKTDVYFSNAVFSCETFLINNNQFRGQVDFGNCQFKEDFTLEESEFYKSLTFTNAHFWATAEFTGNTYHDTVYFTSTTLQNKLFDAPVHFLFVQPEDELLGHILFEHVNFNHIIESDRAVLMELARENKVTIGPGCIKYRAQTRPHLISSSDVNRSLISELTHSFVNYFISSNGLNLGVEFADKSLGSLSIFYFTDDDITPEELQNRLQQTGDEYWRFTPDEQLAADEKKRIQQIDNYVSKAGVLMNIGLKQKFGLWSDQRTQELVSLIPSSNPAGNFAQLNVTIQQLTIETMKIKNLHAHPGSQVNIADRIDHIEFSPTSMPVSQVELSSFKQLALQLNEVEAGQLQVAVQQLTVESPDPTGLQRLKEQLDHLSRKYGVPLVESLAASAVYDLLKALFGIS